MTGTDLILPVGSAVLSAGVLFALWRADVIRPGSLPVKGRRDVRAVPGAVWLLCALVVFLSQVEGQIIAMRQLASAGVPQASVQHDAIAGAAGYGAALIAGVLILLLLRSHAGPRAGLSVRVADVPRGLLAIALAAPVCIFLAWAAQFIAERLGANPDTIGHQTLRRIIDNRDSAWTWVTIASAVVGAPIVEEIMYRALLQSCLLNVLGSPWPAILGTSAVFAAMHIVGGGPVTWEAVPTLFALSVAMGLAYERTDRLGVPMTMHAVFNAGNIAAGLLVSRSSP